MSEDQGSTVDAIVKRSSRLFNGVERSNFKDRWEMISEFVMPSQSGIFIGKDSKGDKKTARLFDSTAIQANQDLANAFNSTLTNQATVWSMLRFTEDELNNNEQAIFWLEAVNTEIHKQLNESNFYTEVSKSYLSYPSLGNLVLMHEVKDFDESPEGDFPGFRFKALHLSEVAWSENKDSIVDTVYRKFESTARVVMDRWGDRASEKVKDAFREDPERPVNIIQAIFPRPRKEIKLNEFGLAPGKNRPFGSIYMEAEGHNILEESGFYEFPVYAVRWSTLPGEVYGRGPGETAIPDIRTLNKVKELNLQLLNRTVNPPLFTNQRNVLGSLDLRPGATSVVRDINGIREFITNARVDVTQVNVQDLKESIRSAFLIDKLLLPPRTETGEMTAFEVSQRLEQMQRVLGPTLSRLNGELLEPLILRMFKSLLRAGALPPAPEILQQLGIDIQIDFINQLARSQQIEEVNNIQAWVQEIAGLAQIKPEVLDVINADGIAKHVARIRSIPEIAINSEEDVEEAREARAQAQQAQSLLDTGVQAADIQSKTGGEK